MLSGRDLIIQAFLHFLESMQEQSRNHTPESGVTLRHSEWDVSVLTRDLIPSVGQIPYPVYVFYKLEELLA